MLTESVSLESVTATPERIRELTDAAYNDFILPAHAKKADPDEPLTKAELYPARAGQPFSHWQDSWAREYAETRYLYECEIAAAFADDQAEAEEEARRGGQMALFYRSDAAS